MTYIKYKTVGQALSQQTRTYFSIFIEAIGLHGGELLYYSIYVNNLIQRRRSGIQVLPYIVFTFRLLWSSKRCRAYLFTPSIIEAVENFTWNYFLTTHNLSAKNTYIIHVCPTGKLIILSVETAVISH